MTTRSAGEPEILDPACPQLEGRAAEPNRSTFRQGSRALQRATMRVLRDRLGGDPETICLAYVAAECAGDIPRVRGAETMAPLLHARMLWREGMLNGWLRRDGLSATIDGPFESTDAHED